MKGGNQGCITEKLTHVLAFVNRLLNRQWTLELSVWDF